jgi:hypothetical protein
VPARAGETVGYVRRFDPAEESTQEALAIALKLPGTTKYTALQHVPQWAIQDSNLGPLPYQRSALTD